MPEQSPPQSPQRPVSNSYHGVKIDDPFRWLEAGDDPEVRAWTAEQNRYTRSLLDHIAVREAIYKRLHTLYTGASADHFGLIERAGRLWALKQQPPLNQPLLVTLAPDGDPASEQVILDPNLLDPDGTTTIDFYVPSLDGRRVAVSLSEKGSEVGTLHVYEVASGRELGDTIPRVTYPTGGGSVAWNADGSGFHYTRYPQPGEREEADLAFYQQVWFHRLGTSNAADEYAIGQDFPRIAEIELERSDDGQWLLAMVANGDGGEYAHYLLGPDGSWTQVTHFEDQCSDAALTGDALFLLSRRDAPRGKLLHIALDDPALERAETVVGQGEAAIQRFLPTDTQLYVVELLGGPSQIKAYRLGSSDSAVVPMEPVSSIGQLLRLGGDTIMFRSNSYIRPPAWYRFDPAEEEPRRTPLYVTSPADFEDAEVVRELAVSRDGTRVPINIIRRKDTPLDGNNPTILYGYGGYGISLSPALRVSNRLWLDAGGIFAIANLRGGGEFGDDWHLAGNLLNKQNVFDDFAACAQYLVDAGYTNPQRLAIEGGSNGGLLMGAALTQHPELFRAVLAFVGIYDMLRVELDPNGAFNVTEFGTVEDAAQFRALYDYSPYHHVEDGVAYPAVLIVTGENDGRVNPAHSRKMTARLQAATSSDRPVLLRTSASAGHGIGTSLEERITEGADVFAFVFDQLGVDL